MNGTIKTLRTEKGFGFIKDDRGTPKGPRAENVRASS